ncbi:hypothetical protein [Streptomyces sp. or20]|nr:hypothetical protein [Streptomyces sp. or20]
MDTNVQVLCQSCHGPKTATEFGSARERVPPGASRTS